MLSGYPYCVYAAGFVSELSHEMQIIALRNLILQRIFLNCTALQKERASPLPKFKMNRYITKKKL